MGNFHSVFEKFQDPVNKKLQEIGIKREVKLFTPPSPDLGDFCFVVNQIAGKDDPQKIAEQIKDDLNSIEGIADVSLFNTGSKKKQIIYMNFKISESTRERIQSNRIEEVIKKVRDENYGQLDVFNGKTAIVEHTSANPIAPIHVGNLRNSVQGDTFARILKHAGYNVFTHYYVNDVGLQIGFVVVGYEVATKELQLQPPVKIDLWIGQIYAIMNCFYTIQKLKREGNNRGANVTENYKITDDDVEILKRHISDEIDLLQSSIDELEDMDELTGAQKGELKQLKIKRKQLSDEITEIDKYQQTFDDLQDRFPDLFDALFTAVSNFDLHERVSKYLKAYENNSDERITALFRDIVSWVLTAFEWTLNRYNIEFDQFDYESDVTWKGLPSDIINRLAKTDNAMVDGQAVRYQYPSSSMKEFMQEAGLSKSDLAIRGQIPSLQLRRSDGTALYAAKDIAYSIQKFEDRGVDKIFNVISSEQALPQFQMLLPLHELGYTQYAANLHHYSYDNVDLQGRTMSGRLAKYITADDYYDETYIRARMAKREADADRGIGLPEDSEEWKEESSILRAVTLASTRFPLIETLPRKRIELDLDRELDFKRNSGPFVQYAHARTNSLLLRVLDERDWDIEDEIDYNLIADYEIVELFNHLDELDERILLAVEEEDPSKIAGWVLTLAQSFMKFYEKFPILKADNEEIGRARLAVVAAIKKGLATGLKILGIPAATKL